MVLPEEFLRRMKEELGSEFEDFLKSYDSENNRGLRVNTLKIQVEDFLSLITFDTENIPWVKEGFYYGAEVRPGKMPLHDAGAFYMQEPSAMCVAALANVKPGEKVLDLCASPGGKSTQLAASLCGEGLLVSNEIHPQRARILSQNIERMGITNCIVTNGTPEEISRDFPEFFDCVVVDAPCSGEGMFRKEEDALKMWSPENVTMCAERQRDILREAVKCVKPGGRLVYSTCTFAREEDEDNASFIVSEFEDFELKEIKRMWPHKVRGEGHFASLFVRKGESRDIPVVSKKKKQPSLDKMKIFQKFAEETFTGEYIKLMNEKSEKGYSFTERGDGLYFTPDEALNLKVKVLRPGLKLGEWAKDRFEPDHALAMALKPSFVKTNCTVDAASSYAAAYLRGESLATGGNETEVSLSGQEGSKLSGWTLVDFNGVSAGWGKTTNGTVKNHYPKGLRVMK